MGSESTLPCSQWPPNVGYPKSFDINSHSRNLGT